MSSSLSLPRHSCRASSSLNPRIFRTAFRIWVLGISVAVAIPIVAEDISAFNQKYCFGNDTLTAELWAEASGSTTAFAANKKAGTTAGLFEFKWMSRDQYFATTGPPQR
jgi:hypothetical protein